MVRDLTFGRYWEVLDSWGKNNNKSGRDSNEGLRAGA